MKNIRLWSVRLIFFAVILLQMRPAAGSAQTNFLATLTTAAEVRNLTVEQAQRHYPVQLRGVVTFFDNPLYSRFIQDATAGIYLFETNLPYLTAGQLVEVRGFTSPGEYAPIIVPESFKILGTAPLPTARPVTYEQLASGKEDSQFVEIAGVVRSVHFEERSKHYLIELATGGGRLTVYAHELPTPQMQDLVDSTVRIRGVCSSQFNRQRQLFSIRLLAPRAEDLTVEIPAPKDPYAIPAQSIGSLFQFTPQGTFGHRIKVSGTVTYFQAGSALYIQDGVFGLFVQTKSTLPLDLGERVEVIGFATPGQYTPSLQDAIYRKIGRAAPPVPTEINRDEALKGDFDCRLIRIEAKLLNHAQDGPEQSLTLESGGIIFHAYQQVEDGKAYARLEDDSLLAITGICLVEPGAWQAGETWRAKSFRVLLRSPQDVTVLRSPPWWTLRKMLWIAGALVFITIGAFTWIVVLRRRVQEQTQTIRQQLLIEADLKERYVDLFENANDMVFTHDHSGKITSINKAGERLLQRERASVVGKNLLDFMPAEQQADARQWLKHVVTGADVPATEWDFLNATGQRIKLEISSRLIEQERRDGEVEGMGRDITARRRLERELLEVSNREQRRIGHDLHDGVCQQLAGIAYLVDILGDKLQKKSEPESADAEKIGGLINEATMQARAVARGLFPVRLEENGLVSALEELADTAASRFKINCRFSCQQPPARVNNETALHLYYIAQEATLNAARHGKATQVLISLEPAGNRFKLRVQDDGCGFELTDTSSAGMGIRIMRYRAKVIGATLDLQSAPEHGTLVACEFDATAPDEPAKVNP